MENIRYNGEEFTVQEVFPRPVDWSCQHLVSSDAEHQFLEYLISVGPYKIDVVCIHELTTKQIAAYISGTLTPGELARQLAEQNESPGKYERT